MCGRFSIAKPKAEIVRAFHVRAVDEAVTEALFLRYNVAPSQLVPIVSFAQEPDPSVVTRSPVRSLHAARWGFVPHYARGDYAGPRPINARAEGLKTGRMFAPAARGRRCVVPATGWYEWQKTTVDGKAAKIPHHIAPAGAAEGTIMAFAALWSPPTDACPDPSVAIVTVPASPGLERIHDRMPAVLTKRDVEVWLAGNTPLGDALQTLMPRGNEVPLVARRVTRYVNTPAHEGPGCVAPDLGDD